VSIISTLFKRLTYFASVGLVPMALMAWPLSADAWEATHQTTPLKPEYPVGLSAEAVGQLKDKVPAVNPFDAGNSNRVFGSGLSATRIRAELK
jgi:hypothetical protein